MKDQGEIEEMQPNDTIGYWLSYAGRCFVSAFFEVLQAHCAKQGKTYAITPPQWGVMALLSDHEEQTIGTLAQHLKVDGPAITHLVKRLEQTGLVERTRSREDQRVVNVSLTTEGKEIISSLRPVVESFQEHLLPPDQRQTLLHQLQYLITRLSTGTPHAESHFGLLTEILQPEGYLNDTTGSEA